MPRDEVWVSEPEQERDLRARLYAEPRLCVACDVTAASQQRSQAEKSAYAGGVYHVLGDRTHTHEED